MPPVEGCDLKAVTTLKSMQDADYLRRIRDEKEITRAVIVGGGLDHFLGQDGRLTGVKLQNGTELPCELPEDRGREIVYFCKISLRGYEAALVLEANGYRNVRVMEGGVMAWPFAREK